MKYSIGYQLPDELDSTYSLCSDYREHISDVYFSWANEPCGRMPLCSEDKKSIEETIFCQLGELKEIRKLGIPLTLLFNANCYGDKADSDMLAKKTLKLCEFLKKELDISAVTTTSPFIAKNLKFFFADNLKIKASVNMRVFTTHAIDQLSAFFDGFYIAKELNRNLSEISNLSDYCAKRGKSLHILANSGCLSFCGFQTYHNNLVAHHKYMQTSNERFPSPCWEYLHSLPTEDALVKILSSNWIRPEDVKNYEKYFNEMKLATRMHSSPRRVVSAYVRGRFSGNLLDLFEPSYSTLFHGTVLDNILMPEDFFEITSSCGKRCDNCSYCKNAVKLISRKYQYIHNTF